MSKTVETIQRKKNLQFGHYKVKFLKPEEDKTINSDSDLYNQELEALPLNQQEFSEGWEQNLPSITKNNPIHHWSVTLAQLPPSLWSKYRVAYEDKKSYTPIIKNDIYYYSVNETKYDNDLKALYRELKKGYNSDDNLIKELLNKLEDENKKSYIHGWLIIRAKNFLKGSEHKYFIDLVDF